MTMAATTLTRGFVFVLVVRWVGGGVGEGVTVTVEVTNTGEQAGDEVVQLYLRDMVLHAPRTQATVLAH